MAGSKPQSRLDTRRGPLLEWAARSVTPGGAKRSQKASGSTAERREERRVEGRGAERREEERREESTGEES